MPILCKHVRSYVHTQATHHTISDMPIPWVNFSNPHLKKYMCLFSRKWWYILIQLAWATPNRNDWKSDFGGTPLVPSLPLKNDGWKMILGPCWDGLIFRGPMFELPTINKVCTFWKSFLNIFCDRCGSCWASDTLRFRHARTFLEGKEQIMSTVYSVYFNLKLSSLVNK